MMKKILIVVDMQNDFINGSLGTKEAENIVTNVIEKINELIVNMQPATISAANAEADSPAARDRIRASAVREALKG